jgi:hypothetical protein
MILPYLLIMGGLAAVQETNGSTAIPNSIESIY